MYIKIHHDSTLGVLDTCIHSAVLHYTWIGNWSRVDQNMPPAANGFDGTKLLCFS